MLKDWTVGERIYGLFLIALLAFEYYFVILHLFPSIYSEGAAEVIGLFMVLVYSLVLFILFLFVNKKHKTFRLVGLALSGLAPSIFLISWVS